ncbi:MAG: galactokinase [Candidatus Sumerlaeota bacterium]|nr:galactokinase [Candidatus Sumerlaeota bacterium]
MAVNLKMLAARCARQFGRRPDVVTRAPGRVNLIGEHTDYNGGFVLPMTVNFDVAVAAVARSDRRLQLFSTDFSKTVWLTIGDPFPADGPLWAKYVAGVADMIFKSGYTLDGADLMITGDVPRGAGLSSSAALELAVLTAFCELENLGMGHLEKICLARQAENEFVGVPCGVMDQFISTLGTSSSALLIDCRAFTYERIPLNFGDSQIIICNTRRKRTLAASAYAERRRECEEGVAALGAALGRAVRALRDISCEEFAQAGARLPEMLRRRCRHVVHENARVLQAGAALRTNDMAGFGALMNQSHASLRDDYEVSCEDLDALCRIGGECEGVLGSRMTGAGFGGCAVHLVRDAAVESFRARVTEQYFQPRRLKPAIYFSQPSQGACRVSVD